MLYPYLYTFVPGPGLAHAGTGPAGSSPTNFDDQPARGFPAMTTPARPRAGCSSTCWASIRPIRSAQLRDRQPGLRQRHDSALDQGFYPGTRFVLRAPSQLGHRALHPLGPLNGSASTPGQPRAMRRSPPVARSPWSWAASPRPGRLRRRGSQALLPPEAPIRNSRLPAGPSSGLGTMPSTRHPGNEAQPCRDSAQTSSCRAGSRTTPPLPTLPLPTSNCGLISATSAAAGRSAPGAPAAPCAAR